MARRVEMPAARARSSMASRSSADWGKSMWACESMSSMDFAQSMPILAGFGEEVEAKHPLPYLWHAWDNGIYEESLCQDNRGHSGANLPEAERAGGGAGTVGARTDFDG